MIPQKEFTEEIAGYIAAFITATQTVEDARIKEQAALCACLITSLARSTEFDGGEVV